MTFNFEAVELSRLFHFGLFGSYLMLMATYFQISSASKKYTANRKYLALCAINLFYSSLVIISTFGFQSQNASANSVLLGSCAGFLGMILFLDIIRSVVLQDSFLDTALNILKVIFCVLILSLLQSVLTHTSWTLTTGDNDYINPFFKSWMNGLVISNPAKLFLGFGVVVIFSANLRAVYLLLLQKNRDYFLIGGVFFSLLMSCLDLTAGMNLNPWTFPMAGLGHFVELLRFHYGLVQSGNVASLTLEKSLNHLAHARASNEMGALLRHNLKNLVLKNEKQSTLRSELGDTYTILEKLIEHSLKGKSEKTQLRLSETLDFSFKIANSGSTQVDFKNQVAGDLIVEGNQVELLLAFYNLFLNSIEAYHSKPNGKKEILCTAVSDEDTVLLKITDFAGGIPDNLKNRIFISPFSTKTMGEGIGLMAVKEALAQNSALIAFVPNPNGAEFQITFFKN